MDKRYIPALLLSLFSLTLLTSLAPERPVSNNRSLPDAIGPDSQPGEIQADHVFSELPLYFVANQGQTDDFVSFYVQGSDKTIYFTSEGVTFALTVPVTPTVPLGDEAQSLTAPPETATSQGSQRWAVKLDFLGARPGVRPVGDSPAEAVISYFKGERDDWQAAVPTYARIRYPELWPGIDLIYFGKANTLKYEFVLQPGADPDVIRLAYRGASDVRLSEDGQLEVSTPLGAFSDAAPFAYQVRDGQRVSVAIGYTLMEPVTVGEETTYQYSFELGAYDPTLPLVLDPEILLYAGFIGGSGNPDSGHDVAVDSAGNAYITGVTGSDATSFPVTVGPDLTLNGEFADAFVAKVNASGTALVYAGYIGGLGGDYGRSIAVDSNGNAYVAGETFSDEASFPVLVGPDLTYNGGGDAFVAKVNASGTDLVYAGYSGGSEWDYGTSIAVDAGGNTYVTGSTASDETTFPVIVGPDLTLNDANAYWPRDAFVAKVNASGTALVYAGYIGGQGYDEGFSISVNAGGNAYVTGRTSSDEASFPVTVGPDLTYNGEGDAFIAGVNGSGTGLDFAGYIGGEQLDVGRDIALDMGGNAYISGSTRSDEASFPVTGGPDLTYNGNSAYGEGDAFVAKVTPGGNSLAYAGYIGGSASDSGTAIAVDGDGNAYLAGTTGSTQASFPVLGGPDLRFNGGDAAWDFDAFTAKVNVSGTALVYAGYIGGSQGDSGHAIALDSEGNSYITGQTRSAEWSFPALVGPYLNYNGGYGDAFIAKVGASSSGPVDLAVARVEVIQAITVSDPYQVHVAGRPALLRLFVSLEGVASQPGVTGRLERYVDGTAQDSLDAGPITAPYHFQFEEGELEATINFNLPAHWLVPATDYVLHLDPENTIPEADESNNRYPAAGAQSFNFRNAPILDVVIVPVIYARPGAPVTNPDLTELTALTWMADDVFPVAQINYTVRDTPYTFTGDLRTTSGWSQLLDEITTLHEYEDPGQSKIYYGLVDFSPDVATGCHQCTVGTAWINSPDRPVRKTAAGATGIPFLDNDLGARIFAHEIAHVYGREHSGPGNYPYPFVDSAPPIGQWGYNTRTGELLGAYAYYDYMYYDVTDNNAWTSDYTYYGIYDAFRWVEGWTAPPEQVVYLPAISRGATSAVQAPTAGSQLLQLVGTIAPDDSVHVEPLFRGAGTDIPNGEESRYRVVLLDNLARELASYPLALTAIAFEARAEDDTGYGFRASLRAVEGLAGFQIFEGDRLVFERWRTGTAPSLGPMTRTDGASEDVALAWMPSQGGLDVAYRVLYSPDGGVSWHLLAASTTQPRTTVPATLLKDAPRPLLLVQVSDGVQTDERTYELGRSARE